MSDRVRITEFGGSRYESRPTGGTATVEAVLREHGVEPNGRRIAVNGHAAGLNTPVVLGDEVTVVPRVQGA